MTDTVDCVVIGAGVVGLAIARALANAGREVLALEQADAIGTETSSRNSEIIHSGIYYRFNSLKRRLCIAGRDALYDHCRARGIPYRQCGKLIVATTKAESKQLLSIASQAKENGVTFTLLSCAEAHALEPNLSCDSALFSPSTGIVDSHALMQSLQGDAEVAGAVFAFRAPFLGGQVLDRGILLRVGGSEEIELRCNVLINAAGLHATEVTRRIAGFPSARVPQPHFAKGTYFTLSGRSPFSHLIYPVPVPGALGNHLTLDMQGNARFGPDIEWVESINYDVDSSKHHAFAKAIERYWPGLDETHLHPGYTGIRPKIVAPGTAHQDFVIEGGGKNGIAGCINLFGIESPGLTACLAIADYVVELVGDI